MPFDGTSCSAQEDASRVGAEAALDAQMHKLVMAEIVASGLAAQLLLLLFSQAAGGTSRLEFGMAHLIALGLAILLLVRSAAAHRRSRNTHSMAVAFLQASFAQEESDRD
ncbi:hypothetical protein E2493_02745 [Sphingomonas parva]|uniref:Uncharacterized protein n=1 Tax=Sphingomonas parva TaxID=2555898 RepID=A0A4Y8ZUR7_9SPHN|nr:hypothetical protein [Sphingomonas parva]TFI59773.1 hypothetical protein E2493_02745 [Sphingomonas parva]